MQRWMAAEKNKNWSESDQMRAGLFIEVMAPFNLNWTCSMPGWTCTVPVGFEFE